MRNQKKKKKKTNDHLLTPEERLFKKVITGKKVQPMTSKIETQQKLVRSKKEVNWLI